MKHIEPVLCAEGIINGITLEIRQGSILDLDVDAIVNAANDKLGNLGGLAGQIINSAGPDVQKECDEYIRNNYFVKPGTVVETSAGKLNFKSIFHTVGPVFEGAKETEYQRETLFESILFPIIEANKLSYKSIGIPGISCGIFGYPIEKAALRHIEAFIVFAGNYQFYVEKISIKKVVFSLYTDTELNLFLDALMTKFKAFEYIKYLGLIKERELLPNHGYCEVCNHLIPDAENYMNISQLCCNKVCNFCIFQHQLSSCPRDGFLFPEDVRGSFGSYILCKDCKIYVNIESSVCSCRQLCYNCLVNNHRIFQDCVCICGQVIQFYS
ncbi:unnamed protein product [Blepharisma stoltei]|uniref:Macro domain-containing protein n=1 Tax=Blepharisma stoltei TaxID=1481888 RepID=A0AAU9IGP6_9CILI|nr:unnamed protein product [Blepharisma stoltei]